MIYKKHWIRKNRKPGSAFFRYTGWFLFGVIPVYIHREGWRH